MKNMTIWTPVDAPNSQLIPLYSGQVSAGFPSPAEPHEEQPLNLHDFLVKRPSSTFFTRAVGRSCVEFGIHDAAILVVDKSLTPRDGDLVVASFSGSEFTVKKLRLKPPRLVPGNDDFPELPIREEHDFKIWGVITAAINQYR